VRDRGRADPRFSAAFRSGFNLHFSDPSLTGWQLLSAVYTMLFVIYRNPDTRLAFTRFFSWR
jgi:hypothetical protein